MDLQQNFVNFCNLVCIMSLENLSKWQKLKKRSDYYTNSENKKSLFVSLS